MSSEILSFDETSIRSIEKLCFSDKWTEDKKLFRYIIWRLYRADCRHIVIEQNYIDRDFGEDFSAFHSTRFVDSGKRCVRLHFFCSYEGDNNSLLFSSSRNAENLKAHLEAAQKAYQGFIVILPLVNGVIGRTVITPQIDHLRECRYPVICGTNVNLDGIPLVARGVPFIQQDGQVGVCSTTAIWMVARLMQLRYGFQRHTLSDITTAANKYLRINRPFPALHGLTLEQIISGFIELGYTPICYDKQAISPATEWNPKEIIYNYLESEVPIIAIIGGTPAHTCVICGYEFDQNKHVKKDGKLVNISELVGSFLVHDDTRGPYLLLPERTNLCGNATEYEFQEDFWPFEKQPNYYTPYSLKSITNIIIPTFNKVYLNSMRVEKLIRPIFESNDENHFRRIYERVVIERAKALSAETAQAANSFLALLNSNKTKLFYRTRFLPSSHLKENYLLHKSTVPFQLGNLYSRMNLPRYIWLQEITLEDFSRMPIDSRMIVGEVLIDATGDEDDSSIISVHFPGFLITNGTYDGVPISEGIGVNEEIRGSKINFINNDSSYELYKSRYDLVTEEWRNKKWQSN